MTLTPGSRVGPYEITAAIGAGGMGEVFRARDTKLSRDVAINGRPKGASLRPADLALGMGLSDLVAAKKTQRDKDWPMVRRLVKAQAGPATE